MSLILWVGGEFVAQPGNHAIKLGGHRGGIFAYGRARASGGNPVKRCVQTLGGSFGIGVGRIRLNCQVCLQPK